jgi:hypothetical protein
MADGYSSVAPNPQRRDQDDPSQAEFFPLTLFPAVLAPFTRENLADSLKLETRGVTSQKNQRELFNRQLLYKSSVSAKLRTMGCLDIADSLDHCHSEQSWAQCTGCKAVRTFWNRCDNFYCPACQPGLSRERSESIEFWTGYVKQPKHVVVTTRNTDHLTFKGVKHFKNCISRLRRRKFAKNWRGGCWALEVTNEERGWHLHAHILVDADWVDAVQLAQQWAKIVGQDFAIVKVKDVRGKDYLKEVTKYACKGSELAKWTGLQIAEFIHAFQKQRTFGVFGSLYGARSDWSAFLASLGSSRQTCECGCDHWEIYDEGSWKIHLHRQNILSGKTNLPPPKPTLFLL